METFAQKFWRLKMDFVGALWLKDTVPRNAKNHEGIPDYFSFPQIR